jgi:hypothetical protein
MGAKIALAVAVVVGQEFVHRQIGAGVVAEDIGGIQTAVPAVLNKVVNESLRAVDRFRRIR